MEGERQVKRDRFPVAGVVAAVGRVIVGRCVGSRVEHRLNSIDSNSDSNSAYRFRFISFPSFDSNMVKRKVKCLDNKNIYFKRYLLLLFH